MKLYRNAIILVVIVALLVGVYFIVSKSKAGSGDTDTESTAIKLTDYTSDKVESVTLKNSDGTFVISQVGTEWTLLSPTDLKPTRPP